MFRNTHQTSFSTILILLSLYLAPVARLCLRFLHFLRGCVVVKATNLHQSSYQTSAVTNVFVTAVVFKVGGREGGTERRKEEEGRQFKKENEIREELKKGERKGRMRESARPARRTRCHPGNLSKETGKGGMEEGRV